MTPSLVTFINRTVPSSCKIQFETITITMLKEYAFRPDSNRFKPIKEFSGDIAHVTTYFHDTDLNILPRTIRYASLYDINIKILEFWIRNNIFKYMYENINTTSINTLDIRLRIAINQISKLKSLPSDTKLYWIEWICDLYKARMRARMEYYLKYIVKLPF